MKCFGLKINGLYNFLIISPKHSNNKRGRSEDLTPVRAQRYNRNYNVFLCLAWNGFPTIQK